MVGNRGTDLLGDGKGAERKEGGQRGGTGNENVHDDIHECLI